MLHKRIKPIRTAACLSLVQLLSLSANTGPAIANHGPGTSGGGTTTHSGQTLKEGRLSASVNFDFTDYENVSRAEAEAIAAVAGGFDTLSRGLITSINLAYGVSDNLQIEGEIGYYNGDDFIDAELEMGMVESGIADSDGLTDLTLRAKYRVIEGNPGHLSIIGGVILPTGKDDVVLDNGEILEPSSQPGAGSESYQAGLAYSQFLTSRLTGNTSAVYTWRTKEDGFEIGDRLDVGAALAYLLNDSPHDYPSYSIFAEATVVSLGADKEDGVKNTDSGGTTVFLGPGVRVRCSERTELALALALPVMQNLSGTQVDTDLKASTSFVIHFD